MTELALTVLMHEGPIARAYLAALRSANLRVEHIILMVSKHNQDSGKSIAPWLPKGIRHWYAERDQEVRLNFWPRNIARQYPDILATLSAIVPPSFGFDQNIYREMMAPLDLQKYTQKITKIAINGLNDPALITLLARHTPCCLLYTGGGIMPTSLLSIPKLRFLHVHPGFLPFVRGADCLLWARLTRDRIGASCFFMSDGIDVGDLICAHEFPALEIPLPADKRPDDQTLYRFLYAFYDPMLRAAVLLQALSLTSDLALLASQPQPTKVGVTYHFMNERLRQTALMRFFPESHAL